MIGLLTAFAATLGVAAIIGSISEALVADTKLEKYVRLIVAFFILIVLFSFVFKMDLTTLTLDYTPKEMVIPDAERIAKAGVLSLSRVELGKQIEKVLWEETKQSYVVTTLHMTEEGGNITLEKVELQSLFEESPEVLEKILYQNLAIETNVEEESHE